MSTVRCIKVIEGRPIAVTGSRDTTLRVWDIERGRALHVLAGHTGSVRCLEVAGHMAVSGSYDTTARVSLNVPCYTIRPGFSHNCTTVPLNRISKSFATNF
jgi:WD40 repeat protein